MRQTDAGWSSLVARRAHNPKVVGSNPAPATNTINTLTGVFLFLAFVKPRSKQEKKMAPFGAILLSPSRQRRAIREVGFNPCQNRLCDFLLEFCGLELTLLFHITDKRRLNQN